METEANKQSIDIDIGVMDLDKAHFYVTAGGFTGLRYNDKDYPRIVLRRALPAAEPLRYISVADSEHKEIGIIRDVSALSEAQQTIVISELNHRYYCPDILAVKSVKDKLGYVYMELRIRSGNDKEVVKSCAIKDVNRNIRLISENTLAVFDVDGNRYMIKDLTALDGNSLKKLEPYLF